MGTSFVQLPFKKFGTWKTKTWLNMMWKNLGSMDIELLWHDIPFLLLQREGNQYIMTEFSGLYNMDKIKMKRLNRVLLSMEI